MFVWFTIWPHNESTKKNVNIFFGTFTVVGDQFIKCILKKSILSSKIMPMFCIWWWRILVLSEHMYILGHLIFSPKLVPSGFFFMYWCLQTLNNKNGGNNQRSFWLRFRLSKWIWNCKHESLFQVYLVALVLRWPSRSVGVLLSNHMGNQHTCNIIAIKYKYII